MFAFNRSGVAARSSTVAGPLAGRRPGAGNKCLPRACAPPLTGTERLPTAVGPAVPRLPLRARGALGSVPRIRPRPFLAAARAAVPVRPKDEARDALATVPGGTMDA